MKTEKFIKVGILYNAFDPSQIENSELLYRKNTSLKTYLGDLPTNCEWKIGLNGVPVTLETDGKTRLKPTDSIQLVVVPRGGGAKNILRMVAMIAIVVGATILFGPGGALAFPILGSAAAGAALAISVATLAGGLLVNALLPPKTPKIDSEESNSYGYDGAKNTARQGVALPVVYGKFRVAGNYVDLFTENVGDDQYLYGRTVLSDGEISNVASPILNDQPIDNFSDVEWGWRAGTLTEEPNLNFNRSIAQISKSIKLTTTPVTHTTTTEVDKLQITFVFSKGLVHITDKGKKQSHASTVTIEYRLQGATTWQPFYSATGPQFTFVDNRLKTIRRTLESDNLPKGVYELRISKFSEEGDQEHDIDETYLGEVGEIVSAATNMRSIANAWYKIKMNEQLNGVPTITWIVDGVKIRKYDVNGNATELAWSDNPAWIVLDMLIGVERGTPGIFSIDFPSFLEWAEWCESEGLKFNGIFDTTSTLWDACVDVLKIGHAAFTRIGTKLSVAIDKPLAPVMLFGPGNIAKGSFEVNFVSMNDRANEFELSYYDKEDNNVQKTVRIVDPDADQRGDIPRAVSFSMPGIDNFEQAEKEVWYYLYNNRYIRRTVSFEAPVESIGLSIGDVALIQHDIVNWGTSGRVDGGTPTSVILDKPVIMEDGNNYSLLVIHNFLNRATGNFSTKTGNVLTVTGVSASISMDNCKRIVQGGIDREIIGINNTGSTYYISIEGSNDFGAGSVVFVDTDVIEERDVVYGEGEFTTVNVASPFSTAPLKYSNYMFGDKEIVKKPYRLKGISGSGYDSRKLTFIEYNPDVFNAPGILMPLPSTTQPKIVNHVSNLSFVNDQFSTYDATVVNGILSWNTRNVRNYSGVDIYISINEGAFSFYKTVFNATEAQIMLQYDNKIVFKVVAFNDTLTRASLATAPTYEVGALVNPLGLVPAPLNLNVEQISYIATALVQATWEEPLDLDDSEKERIRYRVQVKPDGETLWDEFGVTNQTSLKIGDLNVGVHIVRVRSEIGNAYSEWVEDAVSTFLTDESIGGPDSLEPPSVPGNLTLSSELTELGAKLTATWTPPPEADIAGYVVSIKEGTGGAIEFFTTDTRYAVDGLTRNQTYHVRVKAYDKDGNFGQFTAEASITMTKDTVAPGIPTAISIASSFQNFFLSWTNPNDADVAHVEVYENTVNNPTTSTKIATVNALPSSPGTYTRSGLTRGLTRFYWLTAVDTSGNVSAKSGVVSGTTGRISEEDLADLAVTTAKFANTIEPVTLVTSIPTTKITSTVFNTTNGKLYRWDSGTNTYVATVPAGDISGQLVAGQLAADSVIAGTIAAAAISAREIQAGEISADKLVIANRGVYARDFNFRWTGTTTNTLVWDAGRIYYVNDAGVSTFKNIVAGSAPGVTTGTTTVIYWQKDATALSITYSSFVGSDPDNVVMCTWTGQGVMSVKYGATIIDGGRIYANSITADQIEAGTITADEIKTGSLTGDRFSTGTSLPGTITVGTTGVTIETIRQQAEEGGGDPAAKINANTTTIQPGKILISGSTTLANWRNGTDATKIEGGNIAANSITANSLRIGSRAINTTGIDFEVLGSTIYWTAGRMEYMGDNGAMTFTTIPAGSYAWPGSTSYIYWEKGVSSFAGTTNYTTANFGNGNMMVVATWNGGNKISVNYGGTIIDGDRISTGTIDANRLSVTQLSAITANIGLLRTASSGARTEIENNQIRVYNSSNVIVMRLGVW